MTTNVEDLLREADTFIVDVGGNLNSRSALIVSGLATALRESQAENTCDVCVGGECPTETPCMCGGTGKMSRAVENMRKEWARVCVRLDRAEALAKRYEEALRFYANPVTYELDEANGYIPDANIPIFEDEGKRAREALSGEGSDPCAGR